MVDIICPVYNGGTLFSQTLHSVRQLASSDGINVIISDNHSTDGRPWISEVHKLKEKGWKVSIISPEYFMGRVMHWNWAFPQGRERLIKPLLVGDCLFPNYFKVMLPSFNETQDVAFAGSGYVVKFPEKDMEINPVYGKKVFNHEDYLETNIYKGNLAGPLSVLLFTRNALEKALPFDEASPWTSDWRLYMRASKEGAVVLIGDTLCEFNQKENRFSTRPQNIWKSIKEEWRAREYVMSECGKLPPVSQFWINLKKAMASFFVKYGRSFIPATIRKPMGKLYTSYAKLTRAR